jgi:PAS domain-containing protein
MSSNQAESNASSQQQNDKDTAVPGQEIQKRAPEEESKTEGVALPRILMKAIRRRSSSILGSNSSSNGSGNNSDNSGIVSIGNNSFGFNFDSEEGMNNSESNSDGDGAKPAMNTDSAHGSETSEEGKKQKATSVVTNSSSRGDAGKKCTLRQESSSGSDWKSSVSSLTQASGLDSNNSDMVDPHHAAAAAVVANLHSIASQHFPPADKGKNDEDDRKPSSKETSQPSMTNKALPPFARKRSAPTTEEDTGGYNSEADESVSTDAATVARGRSRKKPKKIDDSKREERNAREKERSFRISKQINELRDLLSSGGVIIPKGTKSSVLTEAANYIRMLQQHQYKSEIDRHQLVQQMQMIGGGALGPQASNAVRHVAAQNGVWSLGNFGGVPPKSAMAPYQAAKEATPDEATSQDADAPISTTVQEHDYRFIFNSSPVGMAIASMGGAFIDCNSLFCQLSNYTKQEICSMTVFNLTSRQDLQHAFDLISQMISPPTEGAGNQKPKPCVLRGAMKNRDDLGLSVGLIRGDDGIAKCFCVTLIKNPSSPFDTSRPTPATADLIIPSTAKTAISSAPAYTTG